MPVPLLNAKAAPEGAVLWLQMIQEQGRGRQLPNALRPASRAVDKGRRSLIVDPSGTILADSNNEPGVVFADVDLDQEYWEPWLSVEGFGEFRCLWPKERRPEHYGALLRRR